VQQLLVLVQKALLGLLLLRRALFGVRQRTPGDNSITFGRISARTLEASRIDVLKQLPAHPVGITVRCVFGPAVIEHAALRTRDGFCNGLQRLGEALLRCQCGRGQAPWRREQGVLKQLAHTGASGRVLRAMGST
jgi:hypothetical protein